MFHTNFIAILLLLWFCCAPSYANNNANPIKDELTEIIVVSPRIANEQPASGYKSLTTALRFDPSVELQSRGLAEGQSDVTVRGGIFENTGFKLGALTLLDPQTGHYAAEIPISVDMLSSPVVSTGIDNAIEGFNSTIATISYSFRKIENGGSIEMGLGSDDLNFQSLEHSDSFINANGNHVGFGVAIARSQGDGSVPNGDHQFERASLQVQHSSVSAQTDFVLSYQDKLYGWPGAYTGFGSLAEVDDTQTALLLVNQRRETRDGWLEFGAYYRRLNDDYDFDRTTFETGGPGSFEHETQVIGLGLQGSKELLKLSWRYAGQITQDKLINSTDLTGGSFSDRTYASFSMVPSTQFDLRNGNHVQWRAGLHFDYSNRDENQLSPLVGVTLKQENTKSTTEYVLEYTATSQLPGYTAIKSETRGLFAGNPTLGREKAKQLSAAIKFKTGKWQATGTLFGRKDDNLVDWTYATDRPFARQANPVDIDVTGLELLLLRQWQDVELAVSHTLLDKDSDYGDAQVDASFYALNFAKERTTLAITYRLPYGVKFKLDSEYRSQETNPLRQRDNSRFLASVSLGWTSSNGKFSSSLVIDNATNSRYQTFPGTPANGRQIGFSSRYHW